MFERKIGEPRVIDLLKVIPDLRNAQWQLQKNDLRGQYDSGHLDELQYAKKLIASHKKLWPEIYEEE